MVVQQNAGTVSMSLAQGVTAWEAAYSRFETPEQEVRKFVRRLWSMGVPAWDRHQQVVELFCGRGNGLVALTRMGFSQVEGVDISHSLVSQYKGPARCYVSDCRALPFEDGSKDAIIVQGGLHHLQTLPEDLHRCLFEMHRVLKPDGRVLIVEPWLTPFLSFVHWLCGLDTARRLSSRVDALATMIHHERATYEQWLGQPGCVMRALDRLYETERCNCRWGKLMFLGKKRPGRL